MAKAIVHNFINGVIAHICVVRVVLEGKFRKLWREEAIHHSFVRAERARAHDDALTGLVVNLLIALAGNNAGHFAGIVFHDNFAARVVVGNNASSSRNL